MVVSLSPFEPTAQRLAERNAAPVTHPVIDVHAHIYPAKIAQIASDSVGDFYVTPMEGNGTVEHLIELSEGTPISHRVVHSVAVKPKTVTSINDFIAKTCADINAAWAEENPELAATHTPPMIGFMSMHQDFEEPEAEIDRALAMGLRGMKLHPDTQKVDLDDPRLMNVYEICQAKHVPLIIHTGDYRYDYSHPRRMVNVLHTFPDLVVDAAHFGGWSVFDYATEFMEHERCFMDASSAMYWLGARRTAELVRFYGPDRIMFGSDFPMWTPKGEYDFFAALRYLEDGLGFTDEEFENMTWHNAEHFIGMDIR